jgi:hypothetical protein
MEIWNGFARVVSGQPPGIRLNFPRVISNLLAKEFFYGEKGKA